ncbi:MAG: succinate dehydrogenase assembly factor 2 [Gammaproteobacteria bacterium]
MSEQEKQLSVREHNRVRWLCRRGMKELDLVINRFFENDYESLVEQDQIYFKEFLEVEDPEIFSWIMGRTTPENKHHALIIHKLQNMFDKPIGS